MRRVVLLSVACGFLVTCAALAQNALPGTPMGSGGAGGGGVKNDGAGDAPEVAVWASSSELTGFGGYPALTFDGADFYCDATNSALIYAVDTFQAAGGGFDGSVTINGTGAIDLSTQVGMTLQSQEALSLTDPNEITLTASGIDGFISLDANNGGIFIRGRDNARVDIGAAGSGAVEIASKIISGGDGYISLAAEEDIYFQSGTGRDIFISANGSPFVRFDEAEGATYMLDGVTTDTKLWSGNLDRSAGTDTTFLFQNSGAGEMIVESDGVVRAGNSSVGEPNFTFPSDTDTGLEWHGDNVISLMTGGVGRLFVRSTRVEVDLAGTAADPALMIGNGGGFYDSGSGVGFAQSNDLVAFTADATSMLCGSGEVTSNPTMFAPGKLVGDTVTKPTCDTTTEGNAIYVDDTNDASVGMWCFCTPAVDRLSFSWVNLGGGACAGS